MKSIVIKRREKDADYNIDGIKRYRIGTEENGMLNHIEFTLDEMISIVNQFEFLMTVPDYNYQAVDIRVIDGQVICFKIHEQQEFQMFEYAKGTSEMLTEKYVKWLENRRKRG